MNDIHEVFDVYELSVNGGRTLLHRIDTYEGACEVAAALEMEERRGVVGYEVLCALTIEDSYLELA